MAQEKWYKITYSLEAAITGKTLVKEQEVVAKSVKDAEALFTKVWGHHIVKIEETDRRVTNLK